MSENLLPILKIPEFLRFSSSRFELKVLNLSDKFFSWFFPYDKAFFLAPSNSNFGLRAKISYGEVIKQKPLMRYSKDLYFLGRPRNTQDILGDKLFNFLRNNLGLSFASIRFFGICKELDISAEEIINNFNLPSNFTCDEIGEIIKTKEKYLVFCAEASYGSKKDLGRRWSAEKFLELANITYEKYGLKSVFIGIDNKEFILPEKAHITDLRQKLNLLELISVLKNSMGYVGNDTGPLHLANLLGIKSLGIYLKTSPEEYGPIFPRLNIPVMNPTELPVKELELLLS